MLIYFELLKNSKACAFLCIIKENLQLKTTNGVTKLVGLVDLGQSHDITSVVDKGMW